MSEPRPDGRDEDRWTVADWFDRGPHDLDAALARLEDFLLALPVDRALPDLAAILEAAAITEAHLQEDDRALKVLHEAILARPLSDVDRVASLRTEVELLTLEVRVLTERLRDPDTSDRDVARASARLHTVRDELERLQRQL